MTQTSTELRNIGMERAIDFAERQNDGWTKAALEAVDGYARTHRGINFMAENVRDWAHKWCRVPKEDNGRAWGAVMLRAARAGIIRKVGYGITQNASAHRTPATLWASA